MGIQFNTRPMIAQDRTNWYWCAGTEENATEESEELEELEFSKIKFNEIMREPISVQLNTILHKGKQAFTREMLGGSEDKKGMDIWA